MNLSDEELKKERNHLELTTKLLRQNISDLAQDLYDNEEKQQEFKRYVWDTKAELDPTEMKTILSNNDKEIEDLEMKAKYYKKLYKIQNNPYFGKITYESAHEEIDWFIYEWDSERANQIEIKGKVYTISSPEDFWNYLVDVYK